MVTALILSGGTGTRLGSDIPKQYIEVNGRPIIGYCLELLLLHEDMDAVQIVADLSWQQVILDEMGRLERASAISKADRRKFRGFSSPGKTRQLSVFNGLEDIRTYAAETDIVMIHDAARPCLSKQLVTDCLKAVKGHDGVLPVLPMKDTVYLSNDGKKVSSLLNRNRVFAGQAPEFFVLGTYYKANKCLLPEKIFSINGSTEPAILAGLDIAMIPGEEGNFKITTKADLERFQQIVSERKGRVST